MAETSTPRRIGAGQRAWLVPAAIVVVVLLVAGVYAAHALNLFPAQSPGGPQIDSMSANQAETLAETFMANDRGGNWTAWSAEGWELPSPYSNSAKAVAERMFAFSSGCAEWLFPAGATFDVPALVNPPDAGFGTTWMIGLVNANGSTVMEVEVAGGVASPFVQENETGGCGPSMSTLYSGASVDSTVAETTAWSQGGAGQFYTSHPDVDERIEWTRGTSSSDYVFDLASCSSNATSSGMFVSVNATTGEWEGPDPTMGATGCSAWIGLPPIGAPPVAY